MALGTEKMAGTSDESGNRRSFWRRHRWIWWVAGGAFCFLVAAAIVLAIAASHFEPFIRAQIVDELQRRFETRVELAGFHIAVRHGQEAEWGLWATGRGLRIWPPHRQAEDNTAATAPLIDLSEFSFHVPLRYEMTRHLHIAEVRLKNLMITIPPPSKRERKSRVESVLEPPAAKAPGQPGALANVTIGRVICDGGDVTLETDKPGRAPLEFPIAHLTLTNLAAGKPMDFEAELTNPRPKGIVNASGSFGPWVVDDPGQSPVSGKYHLGHADLSTFNGIAGILASTGSYDGTLRQLAVDGDADVPDFKLSGFGNELPLRTKFHARVDATDGDTWLEPVDATLGHSHFITQGKVVRVTPGAMAQESREPAGKPAAGKAVLAQHPAPAVLDVPPSRAGHLIDLKVDVDRGNLEDFMRLVSHSATPGLIGAVTAKATLHISPGDAPMHLRMKLDGYFKLEDARFTDPKVQDRVEELSLRGQGHPDEMKTADPNSIHSEMEGNFHLDHGVLTLPDLKYGVPGADIAVNGTYNLDGHVKFEGTARMQATVSQMVGGWKGLLLKPVDRFFRKDGAGTLIPIHIRGTRDAPQIGIDFGRMKQTSPEKPGDKDQTHPETPH
jgi:AsmA-like protein